MFNRGRYVLVASTFEPGVLGSFLLRCYASSSTSIRELIYEMPMDDRAMPCIPYRRPQCVTQILVAQAFGIDRSADRGVETYCVISCEGQKVKSTTSKSPNPEWNTFAIFYRKEPLEKPITVEVYRQSSFGFDELIGKQVYVAERDVAEQTVELPLVDGSDVMKQTRLRVVISTSHNLQAI
jgi:calpain-5